MFISEYVLAKRSMNAHKLSGFRDFFPRMPREWKFRVWSEPVRGLGPQVKAATITQNEGNGEAVT